MSRKVPLAPGETSRTACAPVVLRTGVEEKTGEPVSASVLAQRVGWCADLVSAMITGLLAAWPTNPTRRTPAEWDRVRARVPGGEHLSSSIIGSRTRQITAFAHKHGRLPADVFDLEGVPRTARMLVLSACDAQQARLERHESDPGRVLLRLKLPTRPDPRTYADWTWAACPLTLPPTVPASAVLHLPTLRPRGGRVRADLAYTHAVPKAKPAGHTVALGVDWGLDTLLSAGAARLDHEGTITALGSGAQFRASGVLAKQHRLRRQSEFLHAKADHHQRLTGRDEHHPLYANTRCWPQRPGGCPPSARVSTTPWPPLPPGGRWTRPSPPGPRWSMWRICARWRRGAWGGA